MPRRPCLFKERDVTRAAKAVLAAGLEIARVEIAKDGGIIVVPGKEGPAEDPNQARDAGLVANERIARLEANRG
jgi:hypothetical protein